MKRLILTTLLCLLLGPALAGAGTNTHVLWLSSSNSGNTTEAASSGTSPMQIQAGKRAVSGDAYTVDISDSGGKILFRVKDIDVSQAATGTSDFSSGATFGLKVKTCWESTATAFAKEEFQPVILSTAVNSSATPYPVSAQVQPGNFMRIYFVPSGVTPFDHAEIEVVSGFEGDHWLSATPLVISTQSAVVNENSGVSTFTIPAGTIDFVVEVEGGDMRYKVDGADPEADSGLILGPGDYPFPFNRGEADQFRFTGSSGETGVTVYGTAYGRAKL